MSLGVIILPTMLHSPFDTFQSPAVAFQWTNSTSSRRQGSLRMEFMEVTILGMAS